MAVRMAPVENPETGPLPPEEKAHRRDWGARLLSHPLFPGALQGVFLLSFAFVIWQALFGPPHGENNPASTLIWTVWWPLLPLSFFLFARSWCTVCPLGAASAVTQRLLKGLGRRPDSFLPKAGPWVMAASVCTIAVANLVWGLEEFPTRTGLFFVALLLAAVLTGLVYKGHAWCRYLCPIGALSGLFSMFSIMELRAGKDACRSCRSRSCRVISSGDARCPFYEVPPALSSNRNCNLCGNCVKACSSNAFEVRLRNPLQELARQRPGSPAEFLLVVLFIGMTWFEAFRMAPPYPALMKSLVGSGLAAFYDGALLLVFVSVVATIGVICYTLAGTGRVNWPAGVLVPLAIAGHISVGTYHLLLNGPRALAVAVNGLNVPFLAIELEPVVRGSMYSVDLPVKGLQAAILLAGVAASGYLALQLLDGRQASGLDRLRAWGAPVLMAMAFLIVFAMPTTMMH